MNDIAVTSLRLSLHLMHRTRAPSATPHVSCLVPVAPSTGSSAYYELISWAFATVRDHFEQPPDARAPLRSNRAAMSRILDKVLEFRSSLSVLGVFSEQPIPFMYTHLVNLMCW